MSVINKVKKESQIIIDMDPFLKIDLHKLISL